MTFVSRTYANWIALAMTVTSSVVGGCAGDTTTPSSSSSSSSNNPPPPTEGTDFISDNPRGSPNRGGPNEGDSAGAGGGSAAPPDSGADGSGDPERAIAEADIIQVRNGRLYALSRYSGLSVIDISRRDQLSLLGRYRSNGTPFEMYLRDGVVYAMFSDWGQSVYNEDAGVWEWVQTSRIEALDVTNPASIASIGSFDLPGYISDSRIVGDVLYAVTFEDGYCWGCSRGRNTTVTSLSVADPGAIGVVDQLTYGDEDPYGYGWQRSVSVTQDRMYIAGIEWNGDGEGHSTIQVVDISDPGGDLVEGDAVEAAGQIQSRWQMDEHDGVLRVVSQPGIWRSNAMPSVQTFAIVSSQELTPLGSTELRLPRPETLRSVRFDGPRGYAITAEQTDPLFTIDLSDPANPAQVGELEMPGWVYHMEPRGDRLLALGFDNAAAEGSLHVSLFNVADMANPTMIERVHFGGQWSSVAEDQDRIHKAFTILDDLGAILVPYSGWSYDDSGYGCGSYESGIQIIDFTRDALTRRGVAEARGAARRAFVHDARLFAVSDEEVRTFDIGDRDVPRRITRMALANIINKTVVVGDSVVRLSADWWTNGARLEVVPASAPGRAEPVGSFELDVLAEGDGADRCYSYGLADAQLFGHGQNVYVAWPSYDWQKTRLAVFDVSDRTQPRLTGSIDLPFSPYGLYGYYYYAGSIVSSGQGVVQIGSKLVFQRHDDAPYAYDDPAALRRAWLEVVDLSNPSRPTHAATVELPDAAGRTGLGVSGTTVLTSHWVPLAGDPSRARFYFDRIDVTNAASPVVRTPVNVPGTMLAWDGAARRLLSVDYQRVEVADTTAQDCYERFGYDVQFEPVDPERYDGPGTCWGLRRTLKLVDVRDTGATLVDSNTLEDGTYVSNVLVGDDRVFLMANNNGWYAEDGPYGYGSTAKMLVVSGLRDGSIDVASTDDEQLLYGTPVAADGTRLVIASYNPPALSVLDAADLDALTIESKGELSSYVYQVTLDGDRALCSLGHYGLEVVDISE